MADTAHGPGASDLAGLADLSATRLLRGYADGSLSPVEVVQAALDRIERLDPVVNAFCLVDAESAMAQARESEARWRARETRGRLDGVPTSIKDLLLTRGWPTLRGSRLVNPDQPWDVDAPAVARVRGEGAVLLGKTTTPEFGWKGVTDNPLTGVTRNPWDPSRTSGGSSGGSAAAVALGMGALSIGTDGGGSVRIPAGFSGVVGLKPTYGTVPLFPTSPFGTLAHAGPLTRTVADAALLTDVISGFDSRDWSASAPPAESFAEGLERGVAGLRIAYSRDLGHATVSSDVVAAVDAATEVLRELGAVVEEVDPGFEDPVEAYHTLWFAGTGKVLEAYPREQWDALDPALLEVSLAGREITAMQYLDAMQVRADLGLRMGAFHETYDLLVTPTLPIGAFEADREVPPGSGLTRWAQWTPFTYPFNLTQQPAVSVPCGLTADGMPVGLQVVGPRFADALVLRAAAAYESAAPFGRSPLIDA